ncbi:hypothetical protein J7L09_02740 [bacterium]|nr:hypothetical protein [bacterium]
MSREFFDDAFSQRISRREALSDVVRVAGSAALSFIAGGLIGYLFAPRREELITKTITKTAYKTEIKTVTQTITSIKTVTETYRTTKTERPEINIEVQVGKSYNSTAKDYEIGLKVIAPELDSLKAYYENASTSGVIDEWERKANAYYSSFLTQKEIGEQRIRLEVEKDGVRASKEFALNVGLSETEISQSPLNRNKLKIFWKDLLEDSELNLDREELLRKEYEIVKDVNLKQAEKPTSLYLKQLSAYLISNKKSHENVLKGLSLILPLLPSKPWIVYGNMIEDYEKTEFLINSESSYLLAKFLSEIDIEPKHVYAARAIVDQMVTIANWLKIDPFEILEYENKKLQFWDLIKQLFQKHLKFEASGKRASVADDVLIERWSDRSEVNNNKHIYLGLRQVQFPPALLVVDAVNRRYAWEDDKEFLVDKIQPNGFLPPHDVPYSNKALNILSKWIENYENLNSELNEILRNPNKKIKYGARMMSPIERLHYYTWEKDWWVKTYFPNTVKEARKDNYETLLSKGSSKGKNPIILYGYSLLTFNSPKRLEEVRVELASCYGSVIGYPIYRENFNYPPKKKPLFHGEPSFILNTGDENLLMKRSMDRLVIEENTYTLNFLLTRLSAAKKDDVNTLSIYLPTLEVKTRTF